MGSSDKTSWHGELPVSEKQPWNVQSDIGCGVIVAFSTGVAAMRKSIEKQAHSPTAR